MIGEMRLALGTLMALVIAGCSRSSGPPIGESQSSSSAEAGVAPALALSGSSTPSGGDLRTVEVDGLSALAHKPMLVLLER
jgi:hypothetical protein